MDVDPSIPPVVRSGVFGLATKEIKKDQKCFVKFEEEQAPQNTANPTYHSVHSAFDNAGRGVV